MERAWLWFKCAAQKDPVRPVLKQPAAIGWEARHRRVDLILSAPLKPDELLKRMKGWFTSDVHKALQIVEQHGRLKILDEVDLVVETRTPEEIQTLSTALAEHFQEEVWLEIIPRKKLA